MNSWSNEDLARLLRPQQPLMAPEELPKPRRQAIASIPRPASPEAAVAEAEAEIAPRDAAPALRAVPTGPGVENNGKAPGALSQQEIDALMRALNRGTELRLRRQATPGELQRLVNAINAARRLELLAVEAMYGGSSIHWNGSDWVFERPQRQQRAA